MKIGLILILVLTVLFLAVPIGAKSDTGNKSVDQFIQDLKNADPNVRGSAAADLVYLNDTIAVEPLIQALKDENATVRVMAENALDRLNATIESKGVSR